MNTTHFEATLSKIMKAKGPTLESLAASLAELQGRIGNVTRRFDALDVGFAKVAREAAAIRSVPLTPVQKMDAADAALKAKAATIQKANPGRTAAAAYDQALSENPGLYSDWTAAKNARDAAR